MKLCITLMAIVLAGTAAANPAPPAPPPTTQAATKTTIYSVEGMDCQMCVKHIETGLAKKTGVQKVVVDLKAARVTVTYAPDKTDSEKVRKAIEELGYKAKAT